jgi:hypothetical protein
MKRYVSITVVTLFALLGVICQFEGIARVHAQSPTVPSHDDAKGISKQNVPSLDCAGCHGPG